MKYFLTSVMTAHRTNAISADKGSSARKKISKAQKRLDNMQPSVELGAVFGITFAPWQSSIPTRKKKGK